jgi:xylose isomerase
MTKQIALAASVALFYDTAIIVHAMTATTIASRGSADPNDVFHAHVSSIDALARGLRAAVKLQNNGLLEKLREDRYGPWFAGCHGLANALRLNKVRLGSSLAALSSGHRWSLHSTVQQLRVYPCLLSSCTL